MQRLLNKYEKEQLVIKLQQEGKAFKEIVSEVHMSFGDISNVIKRVDGSTNDIKTSNKSKATQALYMFEHGKKPIDIVIELDIPYDEVQELQQEYWALKELYDLAFVYTEIKNDLPSFMKLFKLLKQNKMLGEKHISKILRCTVDLPLVEIKIRRLRNEIINLEFKKKDLNSTITLQRAQLSDLGQAIIKYQNAIDSKKE
jgi:hypothetical protein